MTYSAPACGRSVVSSAYVNAPASANSPAAIQAAITREGEPTLQVITRAFKKIPVPMMLPTLTEIAAIGPNPRTIWCFCVVGCINPKRSSADYADDTDFL